MSYSCSVCEFFSGTLSDVQTHANTTSHHVRIHGFVTPTEPTISIEKIEKAAKEKAYEAEVLRQARHRGLVK